MVRLVRPAPSAAGSRRLVGALAAGCAGLGAAHAWAAARAHALNLDGVSYLDLAERVGSHPGALVNGYWSPLYPALLSVPVALGGGIGPAALSLVHALNFVLYLSCLAAFGVLWRELGALRGSLHPGAPAVPAWCWHAFGALLFLWGTLGLINLWAITPDMLVCGLVLLAFAVLLRIRRGRAGPASFAGLGALLGAAYWAKAAMFVIAPFFLVSAFILASARRRRGVFAAAAVYGLAALPLVAALSVREGRVTFGESGALNWAWYVNREPQRHWRGPGAAHPTRVALEDPLIYEYDRGPGGTYSPWFDPSYWQSGLTPRLDLGGIARVATGNLWYYWERILRPLLAVLAALALTAALARDAPFGAPAGSGAGLATGPRAPPAEPRTPPIWPLALPAAAGLGAYPLVYAETRYVAPFVVAVVGLLAARALARAPLPPHGSRVATAALLLPLALEVGAAHLSEGFPMLAGMSLAEARRPRLAEGFVRTAPVVRDPVVVARAMTGAGLARGGRIAIVGSGLQESMWARLVGVRIVAEVEPADVPRFWSDPDARRRALATLTAIGVDAIVAPGGGEPGRRVAGWRDVASTGYLLHSEPAGAGRNPDSERNGASEPRTRRSRRATSAGLPP